MKKLILLSLALCLFTSLSAQKKSIIPVKKEALMVSPAFTGNEKLPLIIQGSNYYVNSKIKEDIFGTKIGNTWFDLQTNAAIPNRLIVQNDGKIFAVWTMAQTTGFEDRGTGFNFSTDNGATWPAMPTEKIEGAATTANRTGWPNIGVVGGTSLISISHASDNGWKNTKPSLTSGTWTGGIMPDGTGLTWPRIIVNGNTIHLIATTETTEAYANFTNGAMVYWRSTDGGLNWVDQNKLLPNYDTAHFSTSTSLNDGWAIANKGDTIAIVAGDPWSGCMLWKSYDNGANWTYQDILNPPTRKMLSSVLLDLNNDAVDDRIRGCGGSICVALDNNGKAHVFFDQMDASNDGSGSGIWPETDGLYYWNENNTNPISYDYFWIHFSDGDSMYCASPDTTNFAPLFYVEDINHNGILDIQDPNGSLRDQIGAYRAGMSAYPSAVINERGDIVLVYSSVVDGAWALVNTQYRNFRNLWMKYHKFGDNDTTWYAAIDEGTGQAFIDNGRFMNDDYLEEVYAVVAPTITSLGDDKYEYYLHYQMDATPGCHFSDENHPIAENDINFKKGTIIIPMVGINEINTLKNSAEVYPNPASHHVTVKYVLENAGEMTLSIYNLVGQNIFTTTENITAGEVKVNLNITMLPQGIYFIKSVIGNQTLTNKLIVQ